MPRIKTKLPPALALAVALIIVGAAGLSQLIHTRGPVPAAVDASPVAGDSLAVYFSPRGGCTEAVVAALAAARQSVHVQAYSFTSAPIAEALLDAQKRGVKIQIVLDRSQRSEKYSSFKFFENEHIPVAIDAKHAIAHNKIMLIDGQKIITGSFNFTRSAENDNAENLLLITGRPALYEAYEQNFQAHLAHSEPE